MTKNEEKAIEILKNTRQAWCRILSRYIDKQQKEIKDWFEIADNILRATNHYGNITIGDIPKYIKKQQKEIKKEKNRIMELAELLDKQENEIKFLKGELEIQEGCYISKDKIREIRDKAEVMDYYSLNDVIDDLSKLIGDYEEDD